MKRRSDREPLESLVALLHQTSEGTVERLRDFPNLVPHPSTGNPIMLMGTRIAVWQIVEMAREYDNDPAQIASHLQIDFDLVKEALRYAAAYPNDLDLDLLDEDEAATIERLQRILPSLEVYHADPTRSIAEVVPARNES